MRLLELTAGSKARQIMVTLALMSLSHSYMYAEGSFTVGQSFTASNEAGIDTAMTTSTGSGNTVTLTTSTITLSSNVSAPQGSILVQSDGVAPVTRTIDGQSAYRLIHINTPVIVELSSDIAITGMSETNITSGTLILNAAQNINGAGGITLSGDSSNPGTLEIDYTGTISNAFTLAAGGYGQIKVNSGNTATLSGSISGSGVLIKDGAGTLSITQNQFHTGEIKILGGKLAIRKGLNLGSGEVLIDGGTLNTITSPMIINNTFTVGSSGGTFQTDVDTVLSGVIEGNGTLTKTGEKILDISLASSEAFTGDIVVESGTLISTTDHFKKNSIENNGILIIHQDVDGIYNGSITGTGRVFVEGGGLISLGGENTFSGGFSFRSGTTILSSDNSLGSAECIIMHGATLRADENRTISNNILLGSTVSAGSHTFNITGGRTLISGTVRESEGTTASVIKTGEGILEVTGNNIYTGTTTITNGVMAINGSTLSPVVVGSSGTLKGSGIIHADVTVNGTMAPGNSIGTITVDGDYTQASGSTFECEISPTESDLLIVNGNVTIDTNTTFALQPEMGDYTNGTQYTVITSNGGTVTGTFSNFTTSSLLVSGDLAYESSAVLLNIQVRDIGRNANQTAKAVDAINNSSSVADFLYLATLFPTLSDAEADAVLDQLQPGLYKGMTVSAQNNTVRVRETISYRIENVLDRLHCANEDGNTCSTCSPTETIQVWGDVFGDVLHQKETIFSASDHRGYDISTAGITLGTDFYFSQKRYVGILGGYTHSKVKWSQNQGDGDINSIYLGLYGSNLGEMFYGNCSLIGSWNGYSAQRAIVYTGVDRTAQNTHQGGGLLAHTDFGVNFGKKGFVIRPFESLDYIFQIENGFSESGAGSLDLTTKSSISNMLRNELGLNFAKCFNREKSRWIADMKFSWIYEARLSGKKYLARFADGADYFSTDGYFPNRSLFSPGVSLTGYYLQDRLSMNVYYNGAFATGYRDQSFGGQIGFRF